MVGSSGRSLGAAADEGVSRVCAGALGVRPAGQGTPEPRLTVVAGAGRARLHDVAVQGLIGWRLERPDAVLPITPTTGRGGGRGCQRSPFFFFCQRSRRRRRPAAGRPGLGRRLRGHRVAPAGSEATNGPGSNQQPGRGIEPRDRAYDTKSPPSPTTIASRSRTRELRRCVGDAASGCRSSAYSPIRRRRLDPRRAAVHPSRFENAPPAGYVCPVARRRRSVRVAGGPVEPNGRLRGNFRAGFAPSITTTESVVGEHATEPKQEGEADSRSTSATSLGKALAPRPREAQSWSAGAGRRDRADQDTGIRGLGERRSASSAVTPRRAGWPAMITGRSEPASIIASTLVIRATTSPRTAGLRRRRSRRGHP